MSRATTITIAALVACVPPTHGNGGDSTGGSGSTTVITTTPFLTTASPGSSTTSSTGRSSEAGSSGADDGETEALPQAQTCSDLCAHLTDCQALVDVPEEECVDLCIDGLFGATVTCASALTDQMDCVLALDCEGVHRWVDDPMSPCPAEDEQVAIHCEGD